MRGGARAGAKSIVEQAADLGNMTVATKGLLATAPSRKAADEVPDLNVRQASAAVMHISPWGCP